MEKFMYLLTDRDADIKKYVMMTEEQVNAIDHFIRWAQLCDMYEIEKIPILNTEVW